MKRNVTERLLSKAEQEEIYTELDYEDQEIYGTCEEFLAKCDVYEVHRGEEQFWQIRDCSQERQK